MNSLLDAWFNVIKRSLFDGLTFYMEYRHNVPAGKQSFGETQAAISLRKLYFIWWWHRVDVYL